MARLKSEMPRNRVVKVRLNEEEYSMLRDIQSGGEVSIAEIVRKAIRFYCNFVKRTR